MIEQLQIIKPKRVKESLNAILLPDYIVLEFGITKVIIPSDTKFQTSIINHKDLYSFDFDLAIQTQQYQLPRLDLKWQECIINAQDLAVFSSYSGSGDDEYFLGTIEIDNNLHLYLYGFTYMAEYESKKMRMGNALSFNVDYQVYYYLFQMFKSLSGKKTDKLLWSLFGDNLVLTNESRSFYIVCYQNDKNYKYKTKHLSLLDAFFEKETKSEKQLLKKDISDTFGSIAKHLIRPFDDTIKVSENDTFTKLQQEGYVLCLTKQKV